jgi:hypothetical protein
MPFSLSSGVKQCIFLQNQKQTSKNITQNTELYAVQNTELFF